MLKLGRCSLLFSILVANFSSADPVCPPDYLLVNSLGVHWCFLPRWDLSQPDGLNFQGAIDICAVNGDTLPILATDDINIDIAVLGRQVWIGIVCNAELDAWEWQDGQPLNFTAFALEPEPSCTSVNYRFALDGNGWWIQHEATDLFGVVLCARIADEVTPFPAWAIASIAIVSLIICIALIAIVLMARRKIRQLRDIVEEQMEDKNSRIDGKMSVVGQRYYDLPNKSDDWEIERRFVSIDYGNKLGEGAFGSVFLGRVLAKNIPIGVGRSIAELYALTNNNETVAVKMLHEAADSLAERDFCTEIGLMKAIGYHERLVNILACVTLSEPICLITEYCANGDLLEFMRERRIYMLENPEPYDDSKNITVKKQIMFAIQIAYGLEYLSSRGFVHRDVAARNIMVDQHETCKIGDFGLCRAIGNDEKNYQSHGGKLPLKWMSPEAIDQYQFSTASDVWSFGILLFEIVTLGGAPYADWPAAELFLRLSQGQRMERPETCSQELFDVMTHCWVELPDDRPTFTKLRKRLGVLMEDVNQDDYYLKLNAHANYYELESKVM